MSKSVQLLASLLLCCVGFSASAYHLNDHAAIANEAYREFAACFPGAAARVNIDELVQADLDEDLNLIQKLFLYSHFFNPNKDLHMWRWNSLVRVESLKPGLLQCRATGAASSTLPVQDLGSLIHHFQDMTVPAHVVPVHHSAWDGFETYQYKGDLTSGWSCAEIAASGQMDLDDVLKQTALETLAAVKNWRLASAVSPGQIFTGSDFWLEADGDGFGKYGRLGNFFGSLSFDAAGVPVEIADGTYREFKGQRMQAAVRATLRAFVWAFSDAH